MREVSGVLTNKRGRVPLAWVRASCRRCAAVNIVCFSSKVMLDVAARTAITTLNLTNKSSALRMDTTLASRHHTLSNDRRMDQSGRIPLARHRKRVSSVRDTKVLMVIDEEGDEAGVTVVVAVVVGKGGLLTSHRHVFDHTYASNE